jgi:beta-glucosidase
MKRDTDAAFRDQSLSFDTRVTDLMRRLTLTEKLAQLRHEAPAIVRLGIPAYNWLNECLHGVARAGIATVFPQAIGLAATWDPEALRRVASAIGDEARAKHHEFVRHGDRGMYKGLTFFSPNINIFRDPRWGRGHETYGECPLLTSRMAVAYVRGLQGDDPTYLKVAATAKHFAVHSGPESQRSTYDARPSEKDLRETYLPAFEACVRDGHVAAIMGAYNRLNGEPCCANRRLLVDILRDEWGFDGYVVSDGGAVEFFHDTHLVTRDAAESAAAAVQNGCDLELGAAYRELGAAVARGLLAETEVDVALRRVLTTRFRLGLFDSPEQVAYARTPYEINDCEEHRALSRVMACESIVLLKNRDAVLPLARNLPALAVMGPNADNVDVLLGNYNGIPSRHATPIAGIRAAVSAETAVLFAPGCDLTDKPGFFAFGPKDRGLTEAVMTAERAPVTILCLGISPRVEGENGDPEAGDTDAGGDRKRLEIPACQLELLQAVQATGTRMVVVFFGGSPTVCPWAEEHADAILQAWYPGAEGGHALADVLFGEANPSGRLPISIPRATCDLPPFADYRMQGRTYRYTEIEPLYPFGFGLSYTRFEYGGIRVELRDGNVTACATVSNVGTRSGAEVVQCYLTHLRPPVPMPVRELQAFCRIVLAPGETQTVTFTLGRRQLEHVAIDGQRRFAAGRFRLTIGGSQPDTRSRFLGASATVETEFDASI